MKFELGKYYQHTTGMKLHICGLSDTYYHGRCFVGENNKGELLPVGSDEASAVNFHEISKEQFIGKKQSMADDLKTLLENGKIVMLSGMDADGDIIVVGDHKYYVNCMLGKFEELK